MSERGRPPGDGASDDLDIAALLPPLDGAPGPAQRLSSARSSAMVAAVLDAVSTGAGRAGSAPRSPAERRPVAGGPTARTSSPMPGGILDGRPGPASLRVRAGSGRARAGVSLTDTRPGSSARARATTSSLSPFEVTRTVSLEDASTRGARRRRGLTGRGVVIAAVLAATSVASGAAAIWIGSAAAPSREESAAAPAPASPAPASPAIAPTVDRATGIAASGGSVEPVRAEAPEPAPEPEPAAPEPERAAPEREDRAAPPRRAPSRPRAPPARRAEPAAAEAPERVAPEPAVAERAPLPPDAPVEDVVALANQRRKEKRWRAADSLYERVMRESAGTDAAAIATVASAALHLDHLADPAGALRRFQKALRLRPGGPLAEEARWGLAETHRALGDDAAERAALRGFLSAHPRSVNAARARQRLAELGAAP